MKNRIISISLAVVLALSVGLISCTSEYVPEITEYTLNISTTEGGEVTTPSEAVLTFNEGEVIDLVATPDENHHFVNWTGYVGTVANVNSASTTITMEGNYEITANFALGVLIRDWYDLDAIRNDPGGDYILMNDLDSTTAGYTALASTTANQGKGWEPTGTWLHPLAGTFDGQEYEIRALFINRPDEAYVGLFSRVGVGGIVEDIGIVNATVTGMYDTGSLVGDSGGTVTNCYSTASVSGNNVTGGLLGNNWGTVDGSYSTGSVSGEGWVGGLVGQSGGIVSNSYSSAEVVGSSWDVGGLVGVNGGSVSNSYATASVAADEYVGGLVGNNAGTVSNSYATGNVTGDHYVGGLLGAIGGIDNDGSIHAGAVTNCYSTGPISGRYGVGGLIAVGMSYGATVTNSFWDIETSGTTTSDAGTGKTTAEMKNVTTFSDAGWNIIGVANPDIRNPSYIWNIVDGQSYPFLSWQS